MVDINKTDKLLKSTMKSLETQLTSLGIGSGSRKKVIAKVKNHVKHNYESFMDTEDEDEEFATDEQQQPPEPVTIPHTDVIATVSKFTIS